MTLLGIDPGPEQSAIVVWDEQRVVHSEIMQSSAVTEFITERGLPVACEHLQCFGMAVGKEVFETAYWIGEIRHACAIHKLPFHRIYRSDEKMHLCQSMRAKDSNIRQALIDRFGIVGTKKHPGPLFGIANDLWSALAVAVTCREVNYEKS